MEGSVINSPKISTGLYDFQAFTGGKSFLADKLLLSGIKSQVGDTVIAYFDSSPYAFKGKHENCNQFKFAHVFKSENQILRRRINKKRKEA